MNSLSPRLLAAVNKLGDMVLSAAKFNAPYNHIRLGLRKTPGTIEEVGSSTIAKCTVYVDGNVAPDAHAREVGSGLHSTIGEKKVVDIFPVTATAMKFQWPKFFENAPDGENKGKIVAANAKSRSVALNWVEHPGVEATPYMKPAVETVLAQAAKIVADEVQSDIADIIVDIFEQEGFTEI